MTSCSPTLFIPTLRTCAVLDDGLEPKTGVLATKGSSNAIEVVPTAGASTGYVLTYDAAEDFGCAWKAAAGGGGGGVAYAVVQTDAAVIGVDNHSVAVHLANLAAGGGYTATLTGAATNAGHSLSIVLTGLPASSTWTLTVSPAVANAGGGITFEMDTVGQGVKLMWADLSSVAGATSGWIAQHGGAVSALVP